MGISECSLAMLYSLTTRGRLLHPETNDVLMTAIGWHSHSSLLRFEFEAVNCLGRIQNTTTALLLPQKYHSGNITQASC